MKEAYNFNQPYGRWIEMFNIDNEVLQEICNDHDINNPVIPLSVTSRVLETGYERN